MSAFLRAWFKGISDFLINWRVFAFSKYIEKNLFLYSERRLWHSYDSFDFDKSCGDLYAWKLNKYSHIMIWVISKAKLLEKWLFRIDINLVESLF